MQTMTNGAATHTGAAPAPDTTPKRNRKVAATPVLPPEDEARVAALEKDARDAEQLAVELRDKATGARKSAINALLQRQADTKKSARIAELEAELAKLKSAK